MNTEQLRLFLAIARHRSLSRAAADLGLSQATVSERLKALEAEVGAALFTRQGRGVSPTPAGETFHSYAARALEVLREGRAAAQAARAGQGGSVTIAATVTSGAHLLAPALAAFQAQYPDIEVRVRSAHSWESPGLLLDGLADLALISGPAVNPQLETLARFTRPLTVVAGRRHPRAGETFRWEQLARENWIISFWGPAAQAYLDRLRAAAPAGVKWQELSPVELVKGMLAAGPALSLLPEIAARREVAAGELVPIALAADVPRRPAWEISLIRRRGAPAMPAVLALAASLARDLPA